MRCFNCTLTICTFDIACVQNRYTTHALQSPIILLLSCYSVYSDSIDFQIFIIINSQVKTRAQLMRLGFACMRQLQRRPETRPHIDKLITIALSPLLFLFFAFCSLFAQYPHLHAFSVSSIPSYSHTHTYAQLVRHKHIKQYK